MKIKKLLSLLLMTCTAIGAMPVTVSAEEPDTETPTLTEQDDSVNDPESFETPEASFDVMAVTAPESLYVEPSDTNGLPVRIGVFKKQTGGSTYNPTYTYQLYLPGNVNIDSLHLSWDGDSTATVDNTVYTSGNCPVPPVGSVKTYTFSSGNQILASYSMITYQGTADVQPIFIDIDESQGTIAAMDGDRNHETSCVGRVYFNNQWYDMPKIKGRGNYTWWQSSDKKAYNISLGSKTTFPGIDSAATKKWSILAEVADHSLLCNRSGFSLAYELGIGQDTASADVWMNGEYQGCYMVTPKTDSFVTKNGYMIEQDNYLESSVADGGDPQFTLEGLNEASGSGGYNRITVKKMGDNLLLKDGVVDESAKNMEAAADQIRIWLQDAWDAIRSSTGYNSKGKYYTDYIDIESFAKMYLMHEYVKSYDVCAGSILFHRDGQTDEDKLIAGPLWDLDNAMGSTSQNSNLGKADDRSNGDRRSGEGSFIPNITEYKTSIYKTIYTLHEDFRDEVQLQYNKNREAFLALENNTSEMIAGIEESAMMNHNKVNEVNYNNHKYSRATSLGSTQYRQSYLATTNSKTDWPNYTANLLTYIHARSLWFENTYYDPDYVPPCEHTNLINPVWTWSEDCSSAAITFECADCGETVSFDAVITDSVLNKDDTITFTAEYTLGETTYTDTNTANAFIASFIKDEGVERIDVYYTQDYSSPSETGASKAAARDSSTGNPVIDGNGQLNFLVVLNEGYSFSSLTATEGTYKNIKIDPENSGNTLLYRITKITGNSEIRITTEKLPIFIDSASLSLKEKIEANFYIYIPSDEVEKTNINVTFNGKTVTKSAADYTPKTRNGRECRFISVPTFAKQMRDDITITVTDQETGENKYLEYKGEDKTDGFVFKVEDYVKLVEENSDDEDLKDLVHKMDNYSKYAQIQFNYNLDSFDSAEAIEGFDDSVLAQYAIKKDGTVDGLTYTNGSLELESDTGIRLYYTVESGHDISDYTFKVDGTAVTPVKKSGRKYYVAIKGIAARQMNEVHTVTVTDASGNAITVKYSGLSYPAAVVASEAVSDTLKDLSRSIYLYWEAANLYFSQQAEN